MEKLIIAGKTFESRLFLGTGKFPSNKVMGDAIEACDTQMVTTALKRIDVEHSESDDMLHYINRQAFSQAVFAGRTAFEAGLASGFRYAQASSPLTEFLNL